MIQQAQAALVESGDYSVRTDKRELIYEGRNKNLYHSEKPDYIIQEFKTDVPEEGKKRSKTKELSSLRNEISSYLFEHLESFRIPTHFVRRISETEMLVKRLEIIPLTVKVYNFGSGTLMKRFGVKEQTPLLFPVIEYFYKGMDRGSTWVNEYHVYAFGIATPEEFKQVNRLASKANAVLRGLCDRRQLQLAELQLELGRQKGSILLGDELSPLTCRFWDATKENKIERDRFTLDHDGTEEAISELRDRLQLKA
jgi:phosphoribosylaminoimidazole-succinocarboxamide synthase